MSSKFLCELCDLLHVESNMVSNAPNCQHRACDACLVRYVEGMRLFGMLSLGCWQSNCQQPLAGHVVALRGLEQKNFSYNP